jgi:glutamine amidotransferase
MIALVDYGAGNLQSVLNACEVLGADAKRTDKAEDIRNAKGIILPGVGAFEDGMNNLRSKGLIDVLHEQVRDGGKPFLGVCIGLQFLAEKSFENGEHEGLGWIKGSVELMEPQGTEFKIPHMGWNSTKVDHSSPLFEGLQEEPVFYFVHSYHIVPDASDEVIASSEHGMTVNAAVQKGNIFGVQFHPEKSQAAGLVVLKNFFSICDAQN